MKGLPILVIEDDFAIREGLQEFLESEGFQVQVADGCEQGLEVIREHKGAFLVLLDLQHARHDGQLLGLLEKESDPAIRKMPVLALTARAEGFEHARIAGFIRKPVEILDRLLSQVENHVT